MATAPPPSPVTTAPERAARPVSRSLLAPSWALARRELVRFLRQRSRIIGALVQPVLFWILFGMGLSGSFVMPGIQEADTTAATTAAAEADTTAADTNAPNEAATATDVGFEAYFLPGIAAMIVLFTAIFATISIIEDRDAGFLQGVLASSTPRLAVVLGKVGGAAVLAFGQAGLFLLLAAALPLTGLLDDFGLRLTAPRIVALIGFLAVLSVALTSLGYCIAWPSRSTQGYHAIMSMVLFPMWLLSGAFFPAEGAGPLRYVMMANPLTYGVTGMRHLMFPAELIPESAPSLLVCWLVTIGFAAVCVAIGVKMTRRPS